MRRFAGTRVTGGARTLPAMVAVAALMAALVGGWPGRAYPASATGTSPVPLWRELTPTTAPAGRDLSSIAYDSGTGQLVLFGGTGTTGALADTWTWNGTTWTQQSPATSPGRAPRRRWPSIPVRVN